MTAYVDLLASPVIRATVSKLRHGATVVLRGGKVGAEEGARDLRSASTAAESSARGHPSDAW